MRQAQLDRHPLYSNKTLPYHNDVHEANNDIKNNIDCPPNTIYTHKCPTTSSIITPTDRCQALGHKGITLWLTGCPGAGQTTLAQLLEQRLILRHHLPVVRLDLTHALWNTVFRDLDPFQDGSEAVRRTGEMAALMAQAGNIAVVSGSDPWRHDRQQARERHVGVDFVEIACSVDGTFLEALQHRSEQDP